VNENAKGLGIREGDVDWSGAVERRVGEDTAPLELGRAWWETVAEKSAEKCALRNEVIAVQSIAHGRNAWRTGTTRRARGVLS